MTHSQSNAFAGKYPLTKTFCALVVSLFSYAFFLKTVAGSFSEGPILALGGLIVADSMLVGWAWRAWRQRFVGGRAHLSLSKDPLPHGIPIRCTFDLGRIVNADKWKILVKLESTFLAFEDSTNRADTLCSLQLCFPAQRQTPNRVCGEVIMPGDIPPTTESTKRIRNKARLLLMADDIEWEFKLKTSRPAADDKNMMTTPSQTSAIPYKLSIVIASSAALIGLIFALLNGILEIVNNTLTWLEGLFLLGVVGLSAVIFIVCEWKTRRLRFAVGRAHLSLSKDPLPHGVPIQCIFDLEQKVNARNWRVLVKLKSTKLYLTSWRAGTDEIKHSWNQEFPVQRQASKLLTAEVILPIELPTTIESFKQTPDATALFKNAARLCLMADDVAWEFELRTRRPTINEVAVHRSAAANRAARSGTVHLSSKYSANTRSRAERGAQR